MMSGVPLETCWAFKERWNNKFNYKAASCWYFYWVIYDARIHEYEICKIYLGEEVMSTQFHSNEFVLGLNHPESDL